MYIRNHRVDVNYQLGLKGAAKFVNVQRSRLNVR